MCRSFFIYNPEYRKVPTPPPIRLVPIVAALSIIATVLIDRYSVELLCGYKFGFEILLVNGAFTILGLMLCRNRK